MTREIVRKATIDAMRVIQNDAPSLERAATDSEAVITAVHGPNGSSKRRAEAWLALAMAIAAIAVKGGLDFPFAEGHHEAKDATLGLIDGLTELTLEIAAAMAAVNVGGDHAVKH